MNTDTEEKPWKSSRSVPPKQHVWLIAEEKNRPLSWAMIQKIEAAEDFLSLRFLCEYGLVTLASQESMKELFELMRLERVVCIDGRLLHCRIQEGEEDA